MTPLIPRLTLAVALALSGVSLVATAADTKETTEIQIVANGKTEKMSIENLKVGETRQFYSEAGTLVTAMRTAESLELDVGGEKTSIQFHEPDVLMLERDFVEGPIELQVERDVAHAVGDAEAGTRKIVVISREGKLDGDDAHLIVKHLDHDEPGAGEPNVIVKRVGDASSDKQVVVKRRIEKTDATESK